MSKVSLKNINKVYPNGYQAVYDFNIEIKDKEFIVLVGPSGCGKSTTLRMIAGLEGITSGDFTIAGERMNDKAPADRNLAMVFQNYALYGHMTVYENVGFGLRVRKENKDVIHEKTMEAAKVVELLTNLNRKPENLSGGQRQRVALGRTIVRDCELFLMDEPLSNLDAKLRSETRKEIRALHEEVGATTVYVTHDQIEAMTMADRIVIMNKGVVQQIGSPQEVYEKPVNTFVASFIGTPPMNLIEGKIEKGSFVSKDVSVELNEALLKKTKGYEGKDITLGIRPEFVTVTSKDKKMASGIIDFPEMLGAYLLLYTNIGDNKIIVKVDADDTYDMDQKIDVEFDLNHVEFFDAGSTERLK